MFNTTNDIKIFSTSETWSTHKALRMDRNSKEFNLAKPIRELSLVETEHVSCNKKSEIPLKDHSSQTHKLYVLK